MARRLRSKGYPTVIRSHTFGEIELRGYLLLSIGLTSVLCLASDIDSSTLAQRLDARHAVVTPAPSENDWRRTVRGWERTSSWRESPPPIAYRSRGASIHPLVIAALQLLISLGALMHGPPAANVK